LDHTVGQRPHSVLVEGPHNDLVVGGLSGSVEGPHSGLVDEPHNDLVVGPHSGSKTTQRAGGWTTGVPRTLCSSVSG